MPSGPKKEAVLLVHSLGYNEPFVSDGAGLGLCMAWRRFSSRESLLLAIARRNRVSGTCVIGLQWGDEAKGKIVDLLTAEHDLVVRYQGGANAGTHGRGRR